MPEVILNDTEYTIGYTIKIAGHGSLTQVYITDGIAKMLHGIEYIKQDNNDYLYTTDSDGNPKHKSCFKITNFNKKQNIFGSIK